MTEDSRPTPFPLAVEVLGDGFPILCLHGHPGTSQCMGVFTHFLSQNYKTLSPDLRGYGRSKTRAAFDMGDHLQDLIQLLDQHGIQKCLILGWSLGGILAMELAIRYPRRVSGLILIATAAYPRSNHPPITWQDNLFTGLAGIINWIRPGWRWNINTLGRRSLLRHLMVQQTPQSYKYLGRYAVPAFIRTSRHAQGALNQALRQGYNQEGQLRHIQCPCLVLAGEQDRHITATASKATADLLPHSEWICYQQTAHLLPWEIPDRIQQDLLIWLKKYPKVTLNSTGG
ncbi:alpha/beta hydrolase [Acaryochloris sp. IP29b_bin.137]|uniref:alpha/beta fold hydrolase n=1 Tax=Acaryochloris sp. IP29b_bin.137 TaxID=2969217 RepID=UPI0026094A58|nr:alpha/beta hydrolase [Acaryochloris sp. IP29b_bin.137]